MDLTAIRDMAPSCILQCSKNMDHALFIEEALRQYLVCSILYLLYGFLKK